MSKIGSTCECPYNKNIKCEGTKHCDACGWNNAVSKRRLAKIKKTVFFKKAEVFRYGKA